MENWRPEHDWGVTLGIALLLLTIPLFLSGGAQAQEGCWSPADEETDSFVEAPLWIGEIRFEPLDGDGDAFVHNRSAFVQPGDTLLVEFEVVNRVPDRCEGIYTNTRNLDDVVVRAWTDLGDGDPRWQTIEGPQEGACEDELDQVGATCKVQDRLTIPDDAGSSEHRLLYVAGNQDEDGFEALAGAERVVVVDARPDAHPVVLEPSEGEKPRTVYGVAEAAEYDLTIGNNGDYPHWAPNGGDRFWGRPATDLDGNNEPDHRAKTDENGWPEDQETYDTRETSYARDDPDLPPCIGEDDGERTYPWTAAGQASTDVSNLVCSYRAGSELSLPLSYEVEGPFEPAVLYDDAIELSLQNPDKDESLLPGATRTQVVSLFSTNMLAGTTVVDFTLPHEEAGWANVPDATRDNNHLIGEADVLGVDLGIEGFDVTVQGPSGTLSCGSTPETACPTNTTVNLHASFQNVGDEETDAFPDGHIDDPCGTSDENATNPTRCRTWKAAPFVDGELRTQDARGASALATFESVPPTGEPLDLWEDGVRFEPDEDGGRHTFDVRLDHPDIYESLSESSFDAGRIAERTEVNECPVQHDGPRNMVCKTLYFEDEDPPAVEDLAVHAPDPTTTITEGQLADFRAFVHDNSLEDVTAIFTYPDGTTQTAPMTPPDTPEDAWSLSQTFRNHIGTLNYSVQATDAFDHITTEDPLTLEVEEFPKTIDLETLQINGQGLTQQQTSPTYQGNASDPDNWLRLEANVTRTGHEDPWNTTGKTLTLHDRYGEPQHTVPLGVYTVCTLWNTATDEEDGTAEGEECNQDEQAPHIEVQDERPRFYVDTRCDGEDHAGPAGDCQDVDEETREAWEAVEIDWAGTFNLTLTATDVNHRTNHHTTNATLRVPATPVLDRVNASAIALDPGEPLGLSVDASHPLRVDRVYLERVRPDDTRDNYKLTLDPEQDHDPETRNGTYTVSLPSGASGVLAQAGTHELTLVAEDPAGDAARSDPLGIQLVDSEPPVVETLASTPPRYQQAGGPVTWNADVSDATALKDVTLTVDKPASGTETLELAYNEDTGSYQTPTITTTAADVGNWTYELVVEDWTGNTARATGNLTLVEKLPPQAIRWSPDIQGPGGDAYGGAHAPIQVDLVHYGAGVDRGSIEMTVDGEPVTPGIEDIEHGYRLTHEPPKNLAHGDTVHVTVSAADESEPPLVADELSHTYTVDTHPPTHHLDASPLLEDDERLLVGPKSDISIGVDDRHAGPGNVSLVLEELADGEPVASHQTTIEAGEAFRLPELASAYAGHGNYRLLVQARDAAGNPGTLTEHKLLVDDTGPRVSVLPPDGRRSGEVTAAIQDDAEVESARLLYTVDGDEQARPMEHDGENWKATLPELPEGAPVELRVEATDTFGHTSSSAPLTLGDGTLDVEIETPDEGDVLSGNVTVRWTVADADVDPADLAASLQYTGQDGFHPIPEAQNLPHEGSFILDTSQLPPGELTLHLTVTGSGSFGADKVAVHVQGASGPFENLQIGDHNLDDSVPELPQGQTVPLSVELSEDARAAWANVTTADGATVSSHALERADDGSWEALVEVPADAGTYRVELTALTDDGAASTEDAYSFQVASEETGLVSPLAFLGATVALLLAVGFGASKLYLARRGGN